MKTFLLIVISLLISKSSYNQSLNFIHHEINPNNIELATAGIEVGNNDYIFSVLHWENTNAPIIKKINSNGVLIDSILISYDYGIYSIMNLIKTNNGDIIGIGDFKPDTSAFTYIFIISFDANFNLNYINSYITPYKKNLISSDAIINHKDNLVIQGCGFLEMQGYESGYFYGEFTTSGDSISLNFHHDFGGETAFGILEKPDSSGYYSFHQGGGLYTADSPCYRFELDSNFNFLHMDTACSFLNVTFSAKWINSVNYLLSGSGVNNTLQNYIFGVFLTDTTGHTIKNNYFYIPDTAVYTGGCDFYFSNKIYYTGITNDVSQNFPLRYSRMVITQIDSNLNTMWQKFYGGDAFYRISKTVATSDGGCILFCNRYDYQVQNQELDLYIIKIDSLGNCITQANSPKFEISEYIVYPNPGNELKVRISQAWKGKTTFELFDVTGKSVLYQTLDNYTTEIITNSLSAGIYSYKILNNNNEKGNGKWIKE